MTPQKYQKLVASVQKNYYTRLENEKAKTNYMIALAKVAKRILDEMRWK